MLTKVTIGMVSESDYKNLKWQLDKLSQAAVPIGEVTIEDSLELMQARKYVQRQIDKQCTKVDTPTFHNWTFIDCKFFIDVMPLICNVICKLHDSTESNKISIWDIFIKNSFEA